MMQAASCPWTTKAPQSDLPAARNEQEDVQEGDGGAVKGAGDPGWAEWSLSGLKIHRPENRIRPRLCRVDSPLPAAAAVSM